MHKQYTISALLLISSLLYGGNTMAQNIQETNKELIGKFAEETFVKKDLTKLEKYMHQDYIQHNPLVEQGLEGFRVFFQNWFSGVPDFNYTLKKIIADEDHVWVYGTYSGTHKGDWLGITATNKPYDFDAVDIFRIEDGKLAEHWDVLDIYGLFNQLGVIK